jgi:hypothetical protein
MTERNGRTITTMEFGGMWKETVLFYPDVSMQRVFYPTLEPGIITSVTDKLDILALNP